jgi:hypothetical protein
MNTFRIGGSSAEFVDVEIVGRSAPDATDYWDGNWLVSRVTVAAGGFSGAFDAFFRVDEIQGFRDELSHLRQTLRGQAAFAPMEEQLTLRLEGDGKGHITVVGHARDVAGTGNILKFELALDQTYLGTLIGSIDDVLAAYPVRGQPAA